MSIYQNPAVSQNFNKTTTLKNTNNLVRPELNDEDSTAPEDFLATRKLYEDVPPSGGSALYVPRATPHSIPPRYGIRETASMKEKKLLHKSNKHYRGYIPHYKKPADPLTSPDKKEVIIGYSGHVHGMKDGCGNRFQVAQLAAEAQSTIPRHQQFAASRGGDPTHHQASKSDFHHSEADLAFTQVTERDELELADRYERAAAAVCEHGLTQEYLLAIVQSKLTDTITKDSQLLIRTRNMFNKYNIHEDGGLDELEFWRCLESLNVQLLPDQNTALFALFDRDCSGRIEWEEFEQKLCVSHPTGNTSLFPKIITGRLRN